MQSTSNNEHSLQSDESVKNETSETTEIELSEHQIKIVTSFNKTLKEFVDELKVTFSELKETIDEQFHSIHETDTTYLKWFETNVQPFFVDITTKNADIFKNNKALFFLPDINFSKLWKCNITKQTQNAIWRYLHILLLCVSQFQLNTSNFESTLNEWNSLLDNKNINPDELEKMQKYADNIMKLMENLTNPDDDEDDNKDDNKDGDKDDDKDDKGDKDSQTGGGNSKEEEKKQKEIEDELRKDPFIQQLENSKIAQFAKELSSELNISDLGLSEGNKIDSFGDIFNIIGKNPQRVMKLVKSVGNKIQTKLSSGNIQQSELVEEAHTLMSSMQQSKCFKKMFKKAKKKGGLNPQDLFQAMSKQMGLNQTGQTGQTGNNAPQMNQEMMANMMKQFGNMTNSNMATNRPAGKTETTTQERLREKLEQRNQQKTSQNNEEQQLNNSSSTVTDDSVNDSSQVKNKKKKKKKKKVKT